MFISYVKNTYYFKLQKIASNFNLVFHNFVTSKLCYILKYLSQCIITGYESVVISSLSYLRLFFTLDVDECSRTSGICSNGVCENMMGSYQCTCNDGFKQTSQHTSCEGSWIFTYIFLRVFFIFLKFLNSYWISFILVRAPDHITV